jgi:photosystem II stability/assembly factor-like uncharacterized protein
MTRRTYYCGKLGLVRKYNHETSTWSVVSLPVGNGNKQLNDIMCFPNKPEKVVTVGDDGNRGIWLSTDEGANWSNVGLNLAILPYVFEEVWLLNNGTYDIIYVCGTNGNNAVLVKSYDDGATWTIVNIFPPNVNGNIYRNATAVHFYNENVGVIVLSTNLVGTGDYYIAYTIDGGTTWTLTNSGLPIERAVGEGTSLWSRGIQIKPQTIGYRIVASIAEGILRSTDSGATYTNPYTYTINPRIGTHLTWFGDDIFWATDLTGGIIQSIDGGVNWIVALPFYLPGTQPNGQRKLGAHFYKLDTTNPAQPKYIGFVNQDEPTATPVTFSGCYEVESSALGTPFPANISPGSTNDTVTPFNRLAAVWTETYIASCVRLTECNGTKELYIQDVVGPEGNLLSDYVGQYIQVSYVCNENPCPELYGTDGFPICWKVEEVIPNCVGDIIPEGETCFEVVIA